MITLATYGLGYPLIISYYPMPISLSLDTIFYRSAKSTRNGPCSTAMWICNRWSHHAFSIGATAAGPDILLPTEFVYESNYDQVPIGSMYAIYGNIYHPYTPNVSIYTIHGSYGICGKIYGKKWFWPSVSRMNPHESNVCCSNHIFHIKSFTVMAIY